MSLRPAFIVALTVGAFAGCSDGGSTTPVQTPPTPTASITLDKSSAYVGLDSVKLTWSSTNATSCMATGAWSGTKATSGAQTIYADSVGTFSYGISCSENGGSSIVKTAQLVASVFTHSACTNERNELYWQGSPTAPILMGQYMPVNSVGVLEDPNTLQMTACMTTTMRQPGILTVKSSWSSTAAMDTTHNTVFGYQSVGFGSNQLWKAGQSTTNVLPAPISALPDSLAVIFNVATSAPNSHYNTLLILNTTPTAIPDPCHFGEIDIQFDIKGIQLYLRDTTSYRLGNNTFVNTSQLDMITQRPSPSCPNDPTSYYQYIQMWAQPFTTDATVLVKPILGWLVSKGALAPETYLMSITFGTEIGYGAGNASFTYAIRTK